MKLLKNFLLKVISLFESNCAYLLLVSKKRKPEFKRTVDGTLTNFVGMAKFLGESVKDCRTYFENGSIFAPYFALLQSSGTGKTTCMRLIGNLFPTRYVNLGEGKAGEVQEFKKLYDKLVKIGQLKEEKAALEKMKKFLLCCASNLEEPCFFEGQEGASSFDGKEKDLYLKSGITCLCFDEAKVLCETPALYKSSTSEKRNVFELLRKALATLGDRIVLIVADTVSTVANFVSPHGSLSRHIKSLPSQNLFPVVFHMPFSDLKIPEKNEKPEFSIERLSLYGRPLWSHNSEPNAINRLLGLIEHKLVNQTKDTFQKHMAVLGSRLALRILEGNLAEQLVADSLAHCIHISPCRKLVKCVFQSEPLVSEVATHIMNKSLDYHVSSLKKSFQSRTIEIGRTGEILAQLILLVAHDHAYLSVKSTNIRRDVSCKVTNGLFL